MARFMKYISLFVLTIQTTALVLLLRYSRTVPQTEPRYISSTTILISEVLKIISCLLVLFSDAGWTVPGIKHVLVQEIWKNSVDALKLFVPAVLYTVQNNLLFYAVSILDVGTYQVTYQVKILTTAMFSVIILHKRLVVTQWLALVLLMIGVALVQLPSDNDANTPINTNWSSKLVGLFVVLVACFTSGFSSNYFEKIVKSSSQPLWILNLQLAFFSTICSLITLVQDSPALIRKGFFQGYYTSTWIIIFLQAFGGLVVSSTIKYAGNILKGFATSVSIVLSTACSYYLLDDFQPTNYFFLGTTIVIMAIMLYVYPVKKPDEDTSLKIRKEKLSAK